MKILHLKRVYGANYYDRRREMEAIRKRKLKLHLSWKVFFLLLLASKKKTRAEKHMIPCAFQHTLVATRSCQSQGDFWIQVYSFIAMVMKETVVTNSLLFGGFMLLVHLVTVTGMARKRYVIIA